MDPSFFPLTPTLFLNPKAKTTLPLIQSSVFPIDKEVGGGWVGGWVGGLPSMGSQTIKKVLPYASFLPGRG